jgi:hypothetical protein
MAEPTNEGRTELDILNEGPEGEVEDFSSEDEESKEDEVSDEKPDDESDEESEESEEAEKDGDEESDKEDDEEVDEEEETEEEKEETEASLYKRLKSEAPDLFKKFPELRSVIFREQKYAEFFPTVEEAETAHNRNESFSQLESDILSGNSKNLIEAIEKTDKNALSEFAHNLLPALADTDNKLYSQIIELPIKRAIQSVYLNAKKSGNKNLLNAALYVDQFFFEDDGIGVDPPSIKKRLEGKKEKSPELERLEKERDEHAQRIEGEFKDTIIESLQFKMNKEITSSVEKFEFDSYKRRNVVKDIEEEINRMLANDSRYQANIKSLYNQAKSAKFTSDWKPRIISAYLARAKAVLPLAKKKVIEEATGRKATDKKDIKKRIVPSSSGGKVGTGKIDVNRIDKTKTSELDILNDKITYKG